MQGEEHLGMIADHFVRRAPLGDGLAEDLAQPREVLPLKAPGSDNRAAVAVKDEDTVEPLAVDLDQVAQVGEPDLRGRRGLSGLFVRIGEACCPLDARMGLFVKGDQLPDRGVTVPIPQGVQRHLDAVMSQEGIVVQELEDLHHHLDRHPTGHGRPPPRARTQPQGPAGLEASLPIVDHMRIDRQQQRDAARPKAYLEQLDDPPSCLLLGRVFAVGAKANQQVFRAQGVLQALRVGSGVEG